jgi:hypothetical protein
VSGISGVTAEHLINAPEHIMEAVVKIINDMLHGIFPDSLTLGAIAPKAKNERRIRPITLLEVLF